MTQIGEELPKDIIKNLIQTKMKNEKRLILASASVWRRDLLRGIGYEPSLIAAANIDETPQPNEDNKCLALRLAYEKALLVSKQYQSDIVLGADTVVSIARQSMPKALTEDEARFCIDRLSGRRHRVYTGVVVIHGEKVAKNVISSILKFKRLSKEEKENYINSKQWYGKAGGYGLQGSASMFVEWLSGSYSGVIGLPLCQTYNMLTGIGLKPNIPGAQIITDASITD